MKWLLLTLFICIPMSSHAAVVISEVAWMGSAVSANHEWIELQNTSSESVSVDGWILNDGMNLSISLVGTIPANSYAVLERTSDDTVSGSAFLIYTGALVNTGATLTLKRADGGIEDQVAGGENWQDIGGDNVTKETAQYTTSGWVTGTPTPGSANAGVVRTEEPEEGDELGTTTEEKTETKSSAKKSDSGETVRLMLTESVLSLSIEGQKKGYVHQPIEFEVTPSGVGKTIENSLLYRWNFGDGEMAFGEKPIHVFDYPGTYVVTVYGAYKRQEQLARYEITILPVAISVTKNLHGDVQINNDSPYEIDVSKYIVRGERSWRFPDYSIILPKQTVTLPRRRAGGGVVRVFDREGALVASSAAVDSSESTAAPTPAIIQAAYTDTSENALSNLPLVLAPSFLENGFSLVETAHAAEGEASDEEVAELASTTIPSKSKIPENVWPYLGLIIVILLGLFGTATKITRNQNE